MGIRSIFACLFLSTISFAAPGEHCARHGKAEKLYGLTDYKAALSLLEALPAKDAHSWELIGRSHYMLGEFKKATDALEKAVAGDPLNAAYHDWLGKAFGRRAENATPFTAPAYASRARQCFEKAVQLDPHAKEASNDLFEYYLQAPGFLGGGLERAAKLAAQIARLDPVEGHWAQARLAERRKEFGSAEDSFRKAWELAPSQVGRAVDLARFLAQQGRHDESEQAFRRAEALAPESPRVLYDRAETYVRSSRNLDQARHLLKRYLALQLTSEDPPRAEAEKLLRRASGG